MASPSVLLDSLLVEAILPMRLWAARSAISPWHTAGCQLKRLRAPSPAQRAEILLQGQSQAALERKAASSWLGLSTKIQTSPEGSELSSTGGIQRSVTSWKGL